MAKVWARGRLIQLIIIISIKICAPSVFLPRVRVRSTIFPERERKCKKTNPGWCVAFFTIIHYLESLHQRAPMQWKAPLAVVTSGWVVIRSVDLISHQIYWKPFFLPNGGPIQQDILINYLFSWNWGGEKRATAAQELSTLLDLPSLGPIAILSYWQEWNCILVNARNTPMKYSK